jgi:hypothetical protein
MRWCDSTAIYIYIYIYTPQYIYIYIYIYTGAIPPPTMRTSAQRGQIDVINLITISMTCGHMMVKFSVHYALMRADCVWARACACTCLGGGGEKDGEGEGACACVCARVRACVCIETDLCTGDGPRGKFEPEVSDIVTNFPLRRIYIYIYIYI